MFELPGSGGAEPHAVGGVDLAMRSPVHIELWADDTLHGLDPLDTADPLHASDPLHAVDPLHPSDPLHTAGPLHAAAEPSPTSASDVRRPPSAPDRRPREDPPPPALEDLSPGSALVAALESTTEADIDDATLIELIAGWERVASWAAARQADSVLELERRRSAQGRSDFVGDEVAARLSTTRAAGDIKVGFAVQLDRFPAVATLLRDGRIDVRRATALTDGLSHLPDQLAHEVLVRLGPEVEHLTAPQIKARLRRVEIAHDPDGTATRHERSKADRYVALEPAPDAMAWLTAYLPAEDATAIYTALTALAHDTAPEDPRPMGARRADALTDLATRCLDSGVGPGGRPLGTRQRRHPHLEVTATARTILGLDDEPAHLAGYGPIPAPTARRIAARATWTPLLLDARTGAPLARGTRRYRPSTALTDAVVARDGVCAFPGCRIQARLTDLDHITPFDPASRGEEQTTAANLHPLCRHHHRAKTYGGWSAVRDPRSGRTTWTSPSGHRYVLGIDRDPSPPRDEPGDGADLGPPPF